MAKEFITHQTGNDEAWICICGNRPTSQGFYPCDEKGNQVEPVPGWKNLYVCDRCGRIIQQDTLEVIGRKKRSVKITLRLPTGWSKPVPNKGKETCDIDGARLWQGPGGQIYCDLEHDPKMAEAAAKEKSKQ